MRRSLLHWLATCTACLTRSSCECRFVECTPEVGRVQMLPEDSVLIMASDGLWDVLLDQQAVDIAEVCVMGQLLPVSELPSIMHVIV